MNTEIEKLKKIFSLWRDIECLTPFEIHENDFESLLDPNNSAHSPRSSIFKWDEKTTAAELPFSTNLISRRSAQIRQNISRSIRSVQE